MNPLDSSVPSQQLARITSNTRLLLARYTQLQTQIHSLTDQKQTIEEELSKQQTINRHLQTQVQALQVGHSVNNNTSDEKTFDIKKKIDELVHEVDRCVEILKQPY